MLNLSINSNLKPVVYYTGVLVCLRRRLRELSHYQFLGLRTDNGIKHTGRKQPTMAIRLRFLIGNFLVKLFSKVYRDSHTNPYIFVAFLLTELRAPVIALVGWKGGMLEFRIEMRNSVFVLYVFGISS